MRIIDNNGKILTGFYQFKSSRHRMECLNCFINRRFIDAFCMRCANGCQRVVYVKQPCNIHMQLHIDKRSNDIERRFFQFNFQMGAFKVCIFFYAIRQYLALAGFENIFGPRVVNIDDSCFIFFDMVCQCQTLEQFGFGSYVIFHRLVEIQMILRQVSKDSRIIFDTGYPVQCQCMAGYFHNDMSHAFFIHQCQKTLQFNNIRRRIVNRQFFIIN